MTCPANGNLGPHRCGACDNDVEEANGVELDKLKHHFGSLRAYVHALDCAYGETGSTHCPLNEPCVTCQLKLAKRTLALERKSLGEVIALVEQVEAFPDVVALHSGLTPEGREQLTRAQELFYKSRQEPQGETE